MTKNELISLISGRGDAYGNCGGTLDLLMWCGKKNLLQVTRDEAQQFWDDPHSKYAGKDKLGADVSA